MEHYFTFKQFSLIMNTKLLVTKIGVVEWAELERAKVYSLKVESSILRHNWHYIKSSTSLVHRQSYDSTQSTFCKANLWCTDKIFNKRKGNLHDHIYRNRKIEWRKKSWWASELDSRFPTWSRSRIFPIYVNSIQQNEPAHSFNEFCLKSISRM